MPLLAFLLTLLAYPLVLGFAIRHNVVDNPNARKLQRVPVPVMGGTAVFFGLAAALLCGYFFQGRDVRILQLLCILLVMYITGVWDDIKDISPTLRLLIQIMTVWAMILVLGVEINDFHGLFGLHEVSLEVSIPLSLITGVGIMNAVNLIDGIDGYCSTYGIMACICFAVIFHISGDVTLYHIALVAIGALVPFFFHNVFGRSSKMFLGDGGSMMLGTLLTAFVFYTLSANSPCKTAFDSRGLSLVALCLAILAVPVFDTLKVMVYRLVRGRSPFLPDMTHLHHLFIELNFTHLATAAILVFCNLSIVGILLLSWQLGASMNMQVWIVALLSLLFTWLFYFAMEAEHQKNEGEGSLFFQRCQEGGKRTNITNSSAWIFITKMMDSRFLSGHTAATQAEEPDNERPDPRI